MLKDNKKKKISSQDAFDKSDELCAGDISCLYL